MPHFTSRRFMLSTLAAVAFTLVPAAQVVHAGAQPYGSVLVPGYAWAGSAATMGDLNVYSNGDSYSGFYQCTELVIRYAAVRYSESTNWPASSAADMWRVGPLMPVPFEQLPNGGAVSPQPGDIIVYNVTSSFPDGHVAIVTDTAPGVVNVVEQNGSWTGRAQLPISGTYMPPRNGSGQPVIGWLRAEGGAYTPNPNIPGGQILDSFGGLHPFGSARQVSGSAYWPYWTIARDVATQAGNPDAGYVLDGFGGIHAFGGAPSVQITGYWAGWDIARKLVLRADGKSGYVLDGFGGLHPFGVAGDIPQVPNLSAYWPGWDIANGVVLRSDGVSGYVMDGFGGLHSFGLPQQITPAVTATAYWAGWDIARAVTLTSDTGGYVLDGFGGLHAFGSALPLQGAAYFSGHDVARSVVSTGTGGGYILFKSGVVRPFGNAPETNLQLMGLPLGEGVS